VIFRSLGFPYALAMRLRWVVKFDSTLLTLEKIPSFAFGILLILARNSSETFSILALCPFTGWFIATVLDCGFTSIHLTSKEKYSFSHAVKRSKSKGGHSGPEGFNLASSTSTRLTIEDLNAENLHPARASAVPERFPPTYPTAQ